MSASKTLCSSALCLSLSLMGCGSLPISKFDIKTRRQLKHESAWAENSTRPDEFSDFNDEIEQKDESTGPLADSSSINIPASTSHGPATEVWAQRTSTEERKELQEITNSIHKIPVEMNDEVRKWINYFAKRDRARFQRFMDRGMRYREVVENVLEENGLPAELYYLAMIESGFSTQAKSHASAVGVWQFIKGTADRYGLRVDSYVDERQDPIRSTEAAVRYLRDLYNVFGSWHLAMAGYNAGEYRVVRGVFKAKTRNFWELHKKKALPEETRNYVPKFLAAVEIGQNPEKYGFKIPRAEKYPDLVAVSLPSHLHIGDIGSLLKINADAITKVNPHLRRGMVPPSRGDYEIWVPLPLAKHVDSSKGLLASHVKNTGTRNVASALDEGNHNVQRGENLSLIAKKYGMTVAQLRRVNGLKTSQIQPGMKLRLTAKVYRSGHSRYYKVRPGDSLTGIAARFGTSVSDLKNANGLRTNQIFAGTRLKISESSVSYYQVRRGDSLTAIASKHKMSLSDLKALNDLKSNRIYVGARLTVHQGGAEKTKYQVQRGDNLSRIAQKFGTSVQDIKKLNAMNSSVITPGQVLQVEL